MNLKSRLAKLECRLTPVLGSVIVFSIDGVVNDDQQARKEQAEKEGRPVDVVDYEIV